MILVLFCLPENLHLFNITKVWQLRICQHDHGLGRPHYQRRSGSRAAVAAIAGISVSAAAALARRRH
jgi:hypothetical protein